MQWGRNRSGRSGFDRYTKFKQEPRPQKATSHDTKAVSRVVGGLFLNFTALDCELFQFHLQPEIYFSPGWTQVGFPSCPSEGTLMPPVWEPTGSSKVNHQKIYVNDEIVHCNG